MGNGFFFRTSDLMNLRASTVRALVAIGMLAMTYWCIQDFNDTPQKVPDLF